MKVTRKPAAPVRYFKDLVRGALFRLPNDPRVFMKIFCHFFFETEYAINMETGELVEVEKWQRVIPLDGELIVGEMK